MDQNPFTSTLLSWYQQNKRDLPWRKSKDPYRIWLAEIILQQTRVAQGLPYYTSFINAYPRIEDLAKADEDQILRMWQGLGYYSRARNLHKTARIVVEEYNSEFPRTMKELLLLPGIGNYSAAAIASMAFGEPTPVVDGNVYRLLARYFGISMDISSSKAHKYFYELSLNLIDESAPAEYNQAVMEFGALYCTPRSPDCENCVLQNGCIAFSKSLQKKLPVKQKKAKVTKRNFQYFMLLQNNHILMRQRGEKDIWHGLYEFILIEQQEPKEVEFKDHPLLANLEGEDYLIEKENKNIRHVLSHQILNVSFVVIKVDGNSKLSDNFKEEGYRWYNLTEVEELPKPILLSNYLDTYLNSINLQEDKR